MDLTKFRVRLRTARQKTKMNQEEFAKKIGVSRSSLSYYEKGERIPDIATLISIHNETGLSIDYLLGLTDNENEEYAVVNKTTGLSERAINMLQDSHTVSTVIDFILCSADIKEFSTLCAALWNNSIKKHQDGEDNAFLYRFVEETLSKDLRRSIEKMFIAESGDKQPFKGLNVPDYRPMAQSFLRAASWSMLNDQIYGKTIEKEEEDASQDNP